MRIHAFASLCPRCLGSLLLSLLLLLTSPSVVQAAAGNEATAPDCAQAGLVSQPVAVQLTRTEELVQATLHSPPGALPAFGCRAPLEFHIPEDARPPQAIWRDVETRAVRIDGTPDPDPLPLRLWIHPDGDLAYEVREAGLQAAPAAWNLAVAWGTTAAANDRAVLEVLNVALGLELSPQELGARLNDRGRVTELDWYDQHPDLYWEDHPRPAMAPPLMGPKMGFDPPGYMRPKVGIHPPGVRTTWQLPSELGQLTALSRLALGGPLLTGTIPPELEQLAKLEQLTLAGSRLTGTVPSELGQLTKLTSLELHSNRLTALPPELGHMTQLANLNLTGNWLTALPPEIGQLTQMITLSVAGNQLTSLPPEMSQMAQLNRLGVAGNRLTDLPPDLGRLPNLFALDVQDNQLTSLLLAGFDQLYYLDLSGNRLTTLPAGLAQLRHLRILDMSDNRLTTLPAESLVDLFTVAALSTLDLSGNRLTSLPPELGRLRPALQPVFYLVYKPTTLTLDLSGNRLTDLPPELGRISHLVQLDLSDNQLTDLPEALFRLGRLQALNLSGNQLGTVPPAIGDLSTVVHLGLGDNQLTDLPPALGLEQASHPRHRATFPPTWHDILQTGVRYWPISVFPQTNGQSSRIAWPNWEANCAKPVQR